MDALEAETKVVEALRDVASSLAMSDDAEIARAAAKEEKELETRLARLSNAAGESVP